MCISLLKSNLYFLSFFFSLNRGVSHIKYNPGKGLHALVLNCFHRGAILSSSDYYHYYYYKALENKEKTKYLWAEV